MRSSVAGRAGASIRRIARDLGLARNTVSRVLAQVQAQRAGTNASALPRRSQPARSLRARPPGTAGPLSRL